MAGPAPATDVDLLLDLLPPLPPQGSITTSHDPSLPHLSVVVNPRAGSGRADALWTTAAAVLCARGVPVSRDAGAVVERTAREGDGARIGRALGARIGSSGADPGAAAAVRGQSEVLVVVGGDGTVHEVLNGLLLDDAGGGELSEVAGRVEVVLIPAGTANALYHHLFPPESPSYPSASPAAPFYSLLSFLRSRVPQCATPADTPVPALLPVPLALNTLPSTPATLTTVVSSCALHAALLHDAEALRASHPGLDRFKLAAQANVKRWWHGTLRLRGNVRRYDPAARAWVPAADSGNDGDGGGEGDDETSVTGPWAYLVCALVSRFEPAFVVAPFRSPLSPLAPSRDDAAAAAGRGGSGGRASLDVVAIRPLRHGPTAALERAGRSSDAREGFVARVWGVTAGMYDGGRHVDQVYGADEAQGEDDGKRAVCDVWRAEEVEWVPDADPDDLKSRLVCLDGALHDLGAKGGTLRVQAVGGDSRGVSVWA
ncbi:hypothetical protein JCM3770_002303 [Rhodotorula araucariae]